MVTQGRGASGRSSAPDPFLPRAPLATLSAAPPLSTVDVLLLNPTHENVSHVFSFVKAPFPRSRQPSGHRGLRLPSLPNAAPILSFQTPFRTNSLILGGSRRSPPPDPLMPWVPLATLSAVLPLSTVDVLLLNPTHENVSHVFSFVKAPFSRSRQPSGHRGLRLPSLPNAAPILSFQALFRTNEPLAKPGRFLCSTSPPAHGPRRRAPAQNAPGMCHMPPLPSGTAPGRVLRQTTSGVSGTHAPAFPVPRSREGRGRAWASGTSLVCHRGAFGPPHLAGDPIWAWLRLPARRSHRYAHLEPIAKLAFCNWLDWVLASGRAG
jgi:hypothetical protein